MREKIRLYNGKTGHMQKITKNNAINIAYKIKLEIKMVDEVYELGIIIVSKSFLPNILCFVSFSNTKPS